MKWEVPRASLLVLAAGYNLPCLRPQAKAQDWSPLDVPCFAQKVERNQCYVSEHCRHCNSTIIFTVQANWILIFKNLGKKKLLGFLSSLVLSSNSSGDFSTVDFLGYVLKDLRIK